VYHKDQLLEPYIGLLLLTYVNAIPNNTLSILNKFADDTKMTRNVQSLNDKKQIEGLSNLEALSLLTQM